MYDWVASSAPSRRGLLRAGLAGLVVVAALVLVSGFWTKEVVADGTTSQQNWERAAAEPVQVAPPREGITVVTTQASPNNKGQIIAFAPNGSVLYYNETYYAYWDVDPSPAGDETVLYVASQRLSQAECVAETQCDRNVVERVNLTTGEVTRLYTHIVPAPQRFFFTHGISRWHDVDRIDDSRLLIGDISNDRVMIVNTTTGVTEWQWETIQDYPPASGGNYPYDWAHLNDVELLEDGRVMASLRNQDQVVFIDRERGLIGEWTLGSEDDYDTLYEQHNPDYIPADRGGPAVLLADSENNRVAEFQREDGEWTRTWVWQDDDMQWPRDADRLPNGHTLVVDSHGDRIIEIDRQGEVVWSVPVTLAYDAERLGTGDESTGGQSAVAQELAARGASDRTTLGAAPSDDGQRGLVDRVRLAVKSMVPTKVQNAVVFVVPQWMDFYEVIAAVVLVGTLATLTLLELRWSRRIVVRSPVRLNRGRQ